jgi:hypothetical protein
MDDIYILIEIPNGSNRRVHHSIDAGVFHNWSIIRKYCCPGSDRYGKQSNQSRKRSCSKKRNETGCRLRRNGNGCSFMSRLFIATWLGATSLFLDLVLFRHDNIIEFLVYVINVVISFFYRCIGTVYSAMKSHMIKEIGLFALGGFHNMRFYSGVGIHNRFVYLAAKILFGGILPCFVVCHNNDAITLPKGKF